MTNLHQMTMCSCCLQYALSLKIHHFPFSSKVGVVRIRISIETHLNVVQKPLEHNYVAMHRHLHLLVMDVREVIAKISSFKATIKPVRE